MTLLTMVVMLADGAVATFLLFVDLGREGEDSGNSWSGPLSNDASGRGRGLRCPDIATVGWVRGILCGVWEVTFQNNEQL